MDMDMDKDKDKDKDKDNFQLTHDTSQLSTVNWHLTVDISHMTAPWGLNERSEAQPTPSFNTTLRNQRVPPSRKN